MARGEPKSRSCCSQKRNLSPYCSASRDLFISRGFVPYLFSPPHSAARNNNNIYPKNHTEKIRVCLLAWTICKFSASSSHTPELTAQKEDRKEEEEAATVYLDVVLCFSSLSLFGGRLKTMPRFVWVGRQCFKTFSTRSGKRRGISRMLFLHRLMSCHAGKMCSFIIFKLFFPPPPPSLPPNRKKGWANE